MTVLQSPLSAFSSKGKVTGTGKVVITLRWDFDLPVIGTPNK